MQLKNQKTAWLRTLTIFVQLSLFLASIRMVHAQQAETDSILNASHVTSWAYFRDPINDVANKIWYIANPAGTTYGLGRNNIGHSAWLSIANNQGVATLDFQNRKVSLLSNVVALTSPTEYSAISLVGGEGASQVTGNTANRWASLIAGSTINLDWYFFRVESTGFWYIVSLSGANSTILRLQLNASLDNYDWQKPLDGAGLPVDTANWTKDFYQDNGVWKVRFSKTGGTAATSSAVATEFLKFPLSTSLYPQGPYTPNKINSVLDHRMSAIYSDHDGTILTFTGELFQANASYPSSAPTACYPKAGNAPWSPLLSSLYKGTGAGSTAPINCAKNVALNYEAHPGYDYVASAGTAVYAAARGRVVNANDGCVPKGLSAGCAAWGALGIDHENGYVSQYLHLNDRIVAQGEVVVEGQLIGYSGTKAPGGTAEHLHFEVLRRRTGYAVNDYSAAAYATVDPYGFDTSLGYTDYLAQLNNNTANICLWKGGCKYK
jgi:murein DD-endopeptidase MepM/ murein hydrolase activator NlpD